MVIYSPLRGNRELKATLVETVVNESLALQLLVSVLCLNNHGMFINYTRLNTNSCSTKSPLLRDQISETTRICKKKNTTTLGEN